jgi:hypothetical protein
MEDKLLPIILLGYALDVLLDDGSSELFWHHELEEIPQ